jgi:hypothetical protein
VVRLLLHNPLRVDEACAADIADLGENFGHRVLRVETGRNRGRSGSDVHSLGWAGESARYSGRCHSEKSISA